MSQENVELVRRSCEAFARGDIDTAFAAYAPDIEWHTAADEPDRQTYRGIEGMHRFVDDISQLWASSGRMLPSGASETRRLKMFWPATNDNSPGPRLGLSV